MPRLTPAALARLVSGANWLPDPADLRVQMGDDLSAPSFMAMPVYEALPDLLETVQAQAADVAALRLALRLPADAPWTDVLARARHLAELYADDPLRTRDEEVEPLAHGPSFDLVSHLRRQRAFSLRTFGPGTRTAGVLDHIRRELDEVEAAPDDVTEWIDVVLLALDGAWRAGHEPDAIAAALMAKQAKNEARTWPDWRTADPNKAIQHDRGGSNV